MTPAEETALRERVKELEAKLRNKHDTAQEFLARAEKAEAKLAASERPDPDPRIEAALSVARDGVWLKSSVNGPEYLNQGAELLMPNACRHAAEILSRAYRQKCAECDSLRRQKDSAYSERNKLVSFVSKRFPSSLERHEGEVWDDDWRWVVFIDLPTGQVSWHIHDSELPLFAHLPRNAGRKWDGHTTDQKYERLAAFKGAEGADEVQGTAQAEELERYKNQERADKERVQAADRFILSDYSSPTPTRKEDGR